MKTKFKFGQEISFVLEDDSKNRFEGKGIVTDVRAYGVMVSLNENCGLYQRGAKMPVFYEEIKSE